MNPDDLLTTSDSVEVIELLHKQAKYLRKNGPPQFAQTASKIELAFSKAIDEILASQNPEHQEVQS
jgi:hypothetical protein